MYSLLIFLVFVLPVALKKYLQDSSITLFVRILNICFSWFIFSVFFEEFRMLLWGYYENGIALSINEIESCIFNPIYCQIIKAIYFIACFFLSFTFMGIGRGKEYSRILLIKYLFYIWIVFTLYYTNYYYLLINEPVKSVFIASFITALFSGLIILLIYSVYHSKKVKQIFETQMPHD